MEKDLEEAIEASKQPPINGGIIPFQYHDVDYLEVEILKMPVIDMSLRYMWRFSKPVACVLNTEPIRLAHKITQIENKSYEERLKEELLSEWKEMLKTNTQPEDVDDPKAKAMIKRWHNISEVKLFTLNLVRDESSER